MSRTAIFIFALLALALGGAALLGVLRGGPMEAAPAEPLLGVTPSQVRAIRIAPVGGVAASVERAPDGAWALRRDGDESAWPINPSNARGAVRVLSELRPLADAPPDTTINETLAIEVTLNSGDTRSLHIDGETLAGRRLARTGDGRTVFIDAQVVDAFTSTGPLAWRRKIALPGVGVEVSRITLQGPDGSLELARTGSSWRIDEPVRMRASPSRVRELINTLVRAGVQRFIDDPADAADAPVGGERTRLTIACRIDERRIDEHGEVVVTPRTVTLHLGAPADVEGAAYFARTGEGQTLVVDGTLADAPLDPTAYASPTAAAAAPADVGGLIIRPSSGAERGYRRGIDGWRRMRPDGSLEPATGEPVEDLLTFLTQRLAPEVRFERPEGAEPLGVVTLLDFASAPLETIAVLRSPDALICELRPIGAERPVYLRYPDAETPALLQ